MTEPWTDRVLAPDAREAKLPQWAQQKLDNMRRVAKDALSHAEAARLATNPYETDTVIEAYETIPIGLPNAARVMYRLGELGPQHERLWISVRTEVSRAGKYVVLDGSQPLIVRASASNSLRIGVEVDW